MWSWRLALGLGGITSLLGSAYASVTVHFPAGQNPFQTVTGAAASFTNAASYNPTVLNPPPPPQINTLVDLTIPDGGVPPGASNPVSSQFFGFSIEMSVVNQVLGRNGSVIQVPFLNLMAQITQRTGGVQIRVGGNTQDHATLVESTQDGRILEKNLTSSFNPTQTPSLIFTPELLRLLANISGFVNVHWYLGAPFLDTNFNLDIVVRGREILGDRLIGIQAGNEPDRYAGHEVRPPTYGPANYFTEFGQFIQAMSNNPGAAPASNILLGPSISTGFTPDEIFSTGFIQTYAQNLAAVTVQRYASDNCFARNGNGTPRDAQVELPQFLNHSAVRELVAEYTPSVALAQASGKKFMMFETNTASCGGFPGLSDAFVAALWGLDYVMTLATNNVAGVLFHTGGQSDFYNPFTPPPTNQSSFRQWTVGPVYYSALVMAEVLGASNKSQIIDMNLNNNDENTPGYVIYEDQRPVRVLLINYITDPSGASDITVFLSAGGQPSPLTQVKVKYLRADSIAQKHNFTWAGQTFGGNLSSDGRPVGPEEIQTVPCGQTCDIKVPAPAAALVFLSDGALTSSDGGPSTTFPTTFQTKAGKSPLVEPSVLSTSNGHVGLNAQVGSTSQGSVDAAEGLRSYLPGLGLLVSLVLGGIAVVNAV